MNGIMSQYQDKSQESRKRESKKAVKAMMEQNKQDDLRRSSRKVSLIPDLPSPPADPIATQDVQWDEQEEKLRKNKEAKGKLLNALGMT